MFILLGLRDVDRYDAFNFSDILFFLFNFTSSKRMVITIIIE